MSEPVPTVRQDWPAFLEALDRLRRPKAAPISMKPFESAGTGASHPSRNA